MSDSKVSDRARLIRLIDGGSEALREAQEEREKLVASSPPLSIKEPVVPVAGKNLVIQPDKLIRIAALIVLVLLAIWLVPTAWHAAQKPTTTASTLPSPAKTDRQSTPNANVDESGMGLRLVGVDWSDAPVALIEDLKSGKTYFAKKNDKIKGVRIQEINRDHVNVVYQGKAEELR